VEGSGRCLFALKNSVAVLPRASSGGEWGIPTC
jgi:hypothetical protein